MGQSANEKETYNETIFSIMSAYSRKYDAINLGQGFPDFDCDQKLKDLIKKYLQDGKNQYCPMPGLLDLRVSIAQKIHHCYGRTVDPATEITITAGATQAIYSAITALVKRGDEVIIIEPAYDCYAPTIEIVGGKVVPYRLQAPDFTIDWEDFRAFITDQTKLIIINTPHNPIGKTLKEKDLTILQEIAVNHNLYVLSDEVYEHLIYDNQLHQSILRYPALYERSIAVYSFGKTLHATGWKMGYCVAPPALTKRFRAVHQWTVFSVNSFIQYALADYLKDTSTYEALPDFFQQKRDYFNDLMVDSPLRGLSSEGSYFQLFSYEGLSDGDEITFAKWLCREKGVASIPLSPFYSNGQENKLIRLCFAKSEEVLHAAARKLSNF